jgi:hypothetical protein
MGSTIQTIAEHYIRLIREDWLQEIEDNPVDRTPSLSGFAQAKGKITVIQGADLFAADGVVEASPALAGISSASIRGRITFGPCAGARIWRVGDDSDAPWLLSTGAAGAGGAPEARARVERADRPRGSPRPPRSLIALSTPRSW